MPASHAAGRGSPHDIGYVMNKMAQGVVGPTAAALVERVYDIVNR